MRGRDAPVMAVSALEKKAEMTKHAKTAPAGMSNE